MMIKQTADQSIRPAKYNRSLKYVNGDTDDIITVILKTDPIAAGDVKQFARHLLGRSHRETAYNIWKFIKTYIKYQRDIPGEQNIKTPARLWADKSGDCKSYSIFTASILKNLRIPYQYRFVAFNGSPQYTHVYVVIHGTSTPIIIDAVLNEFDKEKSYSKKIDYDMTQISQLSGVETSNTRMAAPVQTKQPATVKQTLEYYAPIFLPVFITNQALFANRPDFQAKRQKLIELLQHLVKKFNLDSAEVMKLLYQGIYNRYKKTPDAILASMNNQDGFNGLFKSCEIGFDPISLALTAYSAYEGLKAINENVKQSSGGTSDLGTMITDFFSGTKTKKSKYSQEELAQMTKERVAILEKEYEEKLKNVKVDYTNAFNAEKERLESNIQYKQNEIQVIQDKLNRWDTDPSVRQATKPGRNAPGGSGQATQPQTIYYTKEQMQQNLANVTKQLQEYQSQYNALMSYGATNYDKYLTAQTNTGLSLTNLFQGSGGTSQSAALPLLGLGVLSYFLFA